MIRFRAFFILVAVTTIIGSGCGDKETPAENILALIDSLEQKLEWVNYRLTEEQWESYRNGRSDSLSFYNNLYLYLISGNELYKLALSNNISDRTDKQRLQILVARTLPDRIEARPALVAFKDSLRAIADSFKVDFQGEEKSLAEVEDTYRHSRSRSQRELGCRAFYAVGENLSSGVTRLIKARNEAAAKLGYENYWELAASQFAQNGVDILQLLKAVDSLTQSVNTGFLDEARTGLGVNELEPWDIPYAHSQIDRQGDTFFPSDSHYTFVKRGLASVGFNLEKLPIYFEKANKIDNVFDVEIFAVRPPHDIRLLTTNQTGFAGIQALLGRTGTALYSAYIAQERPLYNYAADPTWHSAMQEVMAAMAYDSAWLNDVVNLPVGLIKQFRHAKLEEESFRIRVLLADISFIHEAHVNPEQDLNRLYWNLFQKYTGLPSHEDIIIWSTVPGLMTDPMIPIRQLLGKAIAAQSINYMTSYFGPLINNHNTSSFLVQNYFRFGSRYAWSELLQRGTGEKLNPLHLKKFLES